MITHTYNTYRHLGLLHSYVARGGNEAQARARET